VFLVLRVFVFDLCFLFVCAVYMSGIVCVVYDFGCVFVVYVCSFLFVLYSAEAAVPILVCKH